MNPTNATADRHPIDELAEDFVQRFRRGERPALTELTQQHPEMADEITDIVQALLMLEDLGAHDRDSESFSVPKEIGGFRVLREIGRGGMGVVFEAEQVELGRRVALKILPATTLRKPTLLERFRRESRAAGRLHHSNIIPVYGVGAENGIHYYAMQFIPGLAIDEIITELRRSESAGAVQTVTAATTAASQFGGPSSPHHFIESAAVGLQIAEALAYAHAHGVLHRDVKPANIIIDETGAAWLGDFGLAQLEGDQPLTSTGGFVGTLRYLAPERFAGDGDARSDIYSLGATLYELVSLHSIFSETDQVRLARQITQDQPRSLTTIVRSIPKDFETIILKSVAKNPKDRYQSATALADDLRRFLSHRPISARRISRLEMVRRWARDNPLLATLVTTVFLSLSLGLAAFWWQWQRAEQHLSEKTIALQSVEHERSIAQRESNRAWRALRGSLDGLSGSRLQPMSAVRRTVYEELLALHQELASDSSPARKIDQAVIARGLGGAYLELGLLDKAEQSFDLSIGLLSSFVQQNAGKHEPTIQLGQSLLSRAQLLQSQGQFSAAESTAARSVAAFRDALTQRPDDPSDRQWLARALQLWANGRYEMNQPNDDLRQEAIAILRELRDAAADPITVDLELAVFHCENSWRLVAQKQLNAGRTAANDALQLTDKLLAQWPNRCDVIQAAAQSCTTMANIHHWSREPAKALEQLRRNALLIRMLIRDDPDNPAYLYASAAALNNLAKLVGDQADANEGHQLLNEATTMISKAMTINPLHETYRQVMKQIKSTRNILYAYQKDHRQLTRSAADYADFTPLDPAVHVEAAHRQLNCVAFASRDDSIDAAERSQLVREYTEKSLEHLRAAVDRGFARPETLKKVPFGFLSSRPEFQKILQQVQTNADKARHPK